MNAKFLSDTQFEDMAGRLLARYESLYGAVSHPPVPVERIFEEYACHNTSMQKDLI